ncbi:hypothetical protein HRZ16_004360 [Escherichia coli]|nr:hypothetical protein [Escherichia coli]EFU9188822.1 hypothetical protein [Escherichia coli]
MSFKKERIKLLRCCAEYAVLIISLAGCVCIIGRDCFAFIFLWERLMTLPYRYFVMTAFLLMCGFICLSVAVYSNISPHNKISRRVLWCCVVVSAVLQCAGMLLVQAWKWHLPALAGAVFIIEYLSCYWAGMVQKDILDGRLDDKLFCVLPQFWVLVPLTAVGWFFMSGYY